MREKAQRALRVGVIAFGLALIALYSGMTTQSPPPTTSDVLEVPLYPGAQIEFELVLTKEDFLGGIKRFIEAFLKGTRRLPPPPTSSPFSSDQTQAMYYALYAYGQAFGELFQQLLAGLGEFRVMGYSVEKAKVADVADFYDQHFAQAGWRRNFWTRQTEETTWRLYSFSQEGRMRAATFIWIEQLDEQTSVVLISIRGH